MIMLEMSGWVSSLWVLRKHEVSTMWWCTCCGQCFCFGQDFCYSLYFRFGSTKVFVWSKFSVWPRFSVWSRQSFRFGEDLCWKKNSNSKILTVTVRILTVGNIITVTVRILTVKCQWTFGPKFGILWVEKASVFFTKILSELSLIHIWRCRRTTLCRSRWSPYH